MQLEDKQALVFAATGAIGSEVAKTFAREGAHVWLSGRDVTALEGLVAEIKAAGGNARCDIVDATDEAAVTAYVTRVAGTAGRIDVVFNAIGGRPADLGYPEEATVSTVEQFMRPLNVIVGSTFLTSKVVGAKMIEQGGGSIVTLTSTLSVMTAPYMAGISAASAAIEGLTRSLAGEFGPAGVRVNCVRGNGMPETRTIQETGAGYVRIRPEQGPQMVPPPLGRPITVAETAKTAVFLASDASSGLTGQIITVSAGAFV